MNADTIEQTKVKNRRRSYFVNPAFQWKYAITLGFAVYLTTTILCCILYATLFEETRQRVINPLGANFNAGATILLAAFLFAVLTAGTVVALGVITSHRICGPLFVLEGYFRQIAAGKVPSPRALRKKDEFKEVFASFVQATERMRSDRQKQVEVLNGLVNQVRAVDYSDRQACVDALRSLSKELSDLQGRLSSTFDIDHKCVSSKGESNPMLDERKRPAAAGV